MVITVDEPAPADILDKGATALRCLAVIPDPGNRVTLLGLLGLLTHLEYLHDAAFLVIVLTTIFARPALR